MRGTDKNPGTKPDKEAKRNRHNFTLLLSPTSNLSCHHNIL